MNFPAFLWVVLNTLVGVSIQQCTKEQFDVIEQLRTTELEQTLNYTINETYYNCLATDTIIGTYTSMSVSLFYFRSDQPSTLRQIRYDLDCLNGVWTRVGENYTTALRSTAPRTDCYQCINQTINDEHCTCKYIIL